MYFPCDVCRLVHERVSTAPTRFCSLCGAWLCDDCRSAWTWRAVAAIKRLLEVKK